MLLICYPGHLQGFNLEVPLSFPAVPMEVFQLVLKKMTRVFVKGESQMETLSMTTAAEQQTVKMNSDLTVLTQLLNDPRNIKISLFHSYCKYFQFREKLSESRWQEV